MAATFGVYIDESGDEGFRFHAGSSEWFVLSAVITKKADELATVKLVDAVRRRLEKPDKKPLHFRDLKHEQRLLYVDEVSKARLRVVTVFVHKASLKEPETFQERYRLYFYASRLLLERVSWYCRDHRTRHDAGDGSADVVFSNRGGMSYSELCTYLDILKQKTRTRDVRIDWSVVKSNQVVSVSAGKRMGLQIADALAGSFFYAVEPSNYGFTEDRYARMLEPVVYRHSGRALGYGIKFWPRDVDSRVQTEDRFKWLRDLYQ